MPLSTEPTEPTAPSATYTPVVDSRRITEQHADYQRLRDDTRRRLLISLNALVGNLRRAHYSKAQNGDAIELSAQSVAATFIRRQTQTLWQAYADAHTQGQQHYWQTVSQQAASHPSLSGKQQSVRLKRTLGFYAPSIAKMAHEALAAWRQYRATAQGVQAARIAAQRTTEAITSVIGAPVLLGDTGADPLQGWLDGDVGARVALQADIVWPALQAGYVDAGASDPANPYELLYWNLEPGAHHCDDCPDVADGSPYDPPGSGGNELNQSPGDGQTACGAACKCDLAYGGPGEATGEVYQWADFFPTGMPQALSVAPAALKVAAPSAKSDELSDRQRSALDQFRSASAAWDAARGDLPNAPEMFGDDPSDVAYSLPIWDELTYDQQQALVALFAALVAWNTAGAP